MPLSREQSAPSKAPRPLRIVVADDDRDTVVTLMMVLRHEGHEVHGAHTARQALDAVLRSDPDAILLDVALGSESGYDVAQKIRARHGNDRPLIIGISGRYRNDSDRLLAALWGFDDYLVKPYLPSDVLRLLAPLRHWV